MAVDPEDGALCFVKPCEVKEPFGDFLRYVQEQELGIGVGMKEDAVKYAQTRKWITQILNAA